MTGRCEPVRRRESASVSLACIGAPIEHASVTTCVVRHATIGDAGGCPAAVPAVEIANAVEASDPTFAGVGRRNDVALHGVRARPLIADRTRTREAPLAAASTLAAAGLCQRDARAGRVDAAIATRAGSGSPVHEGCSACARQHHHCECTLDSVSHAPARQEHFHLLQERPPPIGHGGLDAWDMGRDWRPSFLTD